MPAPDLSAVALAVLAGGEGSRMGMAKVLLTLDGTPVLHALLDRIAWPGPTLLSVAAHHAAAPGSERFTRIVPDAHPGQGPLRGLYEVLRASPAPLVVVTAVDMPFVTREHLAWLAAGLTARPQATGLMLRRAASATAPESAPELGCEPFPSAFRTSFADRVAERLNQHRRALHRLADDPAVETLAPPGTWPPSVWTNLNTPEDVEAARGRLG